MITPDQRTAIITRDKLTTVMVKIEMASAIGFKAMNEELLALKKSLVEEEESTLIVDACIQYLRMCTQED